MSPDRTVLEHLLDGRNALVLEVNRLTAAIDELDSVIGQIGGAVTATVGDASNAVDLRPREPVNSRPQVEATAPSAPSRATTATTGTSTAAKPAGRPRKATPAKPSTSRRKRGTQEAPAAGQKSIRVHVLEMLAAEDRDFGLAEIIDRIHGQGIQAHDDAVRSITIKLMKDGRVERVGRGLYRLAGRPARNAPSPSADAASSEQSEPTQPEVQAPVANYVPPLNLGQAWERP